MGLEVVAAAELGFSLDDVRSTVRDELSMFRERHPIRKKLTAQSEGNPNTASTALTICRVTPAGGAPVGRMWDVRAIWVGLTTLAAAGSSGVVFIGNSSQAMTNVGNSSDTYKVEDAVLSFTGVPYSNSFSKFTYTLGYGDELYVGIFGVASGAVVVVNARVDEWDIDAVSARRI